MSRAPKTGILQMYNGLEKPLYIKITKADKRERESGDRVYGKDGCEIPLHLSSSESKW